MKAITIASYILRLDTMDHLKLQKLLYFVQALHLVKFSTVAFSDDIFTDDSGILIPEVYDKRKKIKSRNNLNTETLLVIDQVMIHYSNMSGIQLLNELQSDPAWGKAYKLKSIVNIQDMKAYYSTIYCFE